MPDTPPRDRERHAVQTVLRRARQDAGLTQVEVAARLGIPQSFISKYEAGTRGLDICELRRVLAALELPLDSFLHQLDAELAAGD